MEYLNKFESVLRDDEQVLWTGAVNKSAYKKSVLRAMALWGLFPMFLPFMLLALTIFLPFTIMLINKAADNSFLCVTNKQVVLRKGIFATDYVRMAMSAVGNIEVNANIFDSKTAPESASLLCYSKTPAVSKEGNSWPTIYVKNLINAHEAYKVISKHGDNEALKVKTI